MNVNPGLLALLFEQYDVFRSKTGYIYTINRERTNVEQDIQGLILFI